MISPNLLSDSLATRVASEVICSKLRDATMDYLANEITANVSKELLDISLVYIEEMKRNMFFEKLFKSLSSHERKFGTMIKGIWEEQRLIIVANLKKIKKAYLTKDAIDQILYPRKQFEAKIAKEAKPLLEANIEERGQEEMAKIEAELRKPRKQAPEAVLGVAFDVENPEVQRWLTDYTPKLSKNLEKVSTAKLRTELTEGMKAGEGVPLLTKRVNNTYNNWNKVRSETIARSEAIRASNRGALESYRQSGVVKKKLWIAEPDACLWCAPLDGKIVDIETSFFDIGDEYTVSVNGKGQTMQLDYETVETPPLHPRCRCAIAASFEDMAVMKPWRPARTLKEAEQWANNRGFYYGKRADLFKDANPSQLNQIRREMVMFRKLDLKLANEFNRQMFLLEQKLKPEYFNRLIQSKIKFYSVNTGIEGAEGMTIQGIFDKKLAMNIGDKILIDPTKRTTAKYFVDASLGGTIRHEICHALKHAIRFPSYVELNVNLVWTQTGWLPSEYAEMNFSELWAEWVSLITKKGFKLSSIPTAAQKKAKLILSGKG